MRSISLSFRNERGPKPDMRTATILLAQAENVEKQVRDLQKIALPAHQQHAQWLYERMESLEIQPSQDQQIELTIRQGKHAIDEQLSKHSEIALRQAVYVKYIYKNHFIPISSLEAAATDHILQNMINALMLSNRHLAMLEALKNLENKHYSNRASAGGQGKNQQPSNSMKSLLLKSMIRGMIYNDPKFKKLDKTVAADEMATRIFKANKEYQMLDITNLEDLKFQVRNVLFDITRTVTRGSQRQADREQLGYSLRHSFPKQDTEESRQMDLDAARTLGRIEGVRATLALQLKQRFGELPKSAIEKLEATNDMDQLQTCAEQLAEVRSLDDVIQKLQ